MFFDARASGRFDLVFVRTRFFARAGGPGLGLAAGSMPVCQVPGLAVGVYAGLLLSALAVCVSQIFSLSLLATARGSASFPGP